MRSIQEEIALARDQEISKRRVSSREEVKWNGYGV
jgi:hypothetical protein